MTECDGDVVTLFMIWIFHSIDLSSSLITLALLVLLLLLLLLLFDQSILTAPRQSDRPGPRCGGEDGRERSSEKGERRPEESVASVEGPVERRRRIQSGRGFAQRSGNRRQDQQLRYESHAHEPEKEKEVGVARVVKVEELVAGVVVA